MIAAYGAKTNGKSNDGINLSVPQGTPVKAADDGVVAYSGNELKGYGNLVLVRHSNGYVTAYAHASELMVKRGDTIKRGQVIAKAGQTGEVSSPQLHFEIRKGSTPVVSMHLRWWLDATGVGEEDTAEAGPTPGLFVSVMSPSASRQAVLQGPARTARRRGRTARRASSTIPAHHV